MPSWIRPRAALPDEYLRHAARTRRAFTIDLELDDIAAPNDGNIAEVLHFGAGELKAKKLSAFGMEFSRCSKHIRLVLPFFLAAAHDDGPGRHQLLKRLCVACEPGAPYSFAGLQQLRVILLRTRLSRAHGGSQQRRSNKHASAVRPNNQSPRKLSHRSLLCVSRLKVRSASKTAAPDAEKTE